MTPWSDSFADGTRIPGQFAWNASTVHRDVFTLFAADLNGLPLEGRFIAAEARQAIDEHVLDTAAITGTCTLDPRLA